MQKYSNPAVWSLLAGVLIHPGNDPNGLPDHGAVVRHVPADRRSRADAHIVPDADIPYQNGVGADQAIVPNLRRFTAHLADGNILVDPAPAANSGIPGNVYSMEPVGQ